MRESTVLSDSRRRMGIATRWGVCRATIAPHFSSETTRAYAPEPRGHTGEAVGDQTAADGKQERSRLLAVSCELPRIRTHMPPTLASCRGATHRDCRPPHGRAPPQPHDGEVPAHASREIFAPHIGSYGFPE